MIHASERNVDVSRLVEVWDFTYAPVEAIIVLGVAIAEGIGGPGLIRNVLETLASEGGGHVDVWRAIAAATGYNGRRGKAGQERSDND